MELFDRDFPGNYLRTVKTVRVTVIALTPPSQGLCATVANTGVTRMVTGPHIFRATTVRREPETIALSSAVAATGLFEMRADDPMLAPFEGGGVDATWELRMPKAANPFNYRRPGTRGGDGSFLYCARWWREPW